VSAQDEMSPEPVIREVDGKCHLEIPLSETEPINPKEYRMYYLYSLLSYKTKVEPALVHGSGEGAYMKLDMNMGCDEVLRIIIESL